MSEDIGSKLTGMLDEPEQPKQEQEAGPVEMDENLLIQDYYRVQSLEITDPGTIRRLGYDKDSCKNGPRKVLERVSLLAIAPHAQKWQMSTGSKTRFFVAHWRVTAPHGLFPAISSKTRMDLRSVMSNGQILHESLSYPYLAGIAKRDICTHLKWGGNKYSSKVKPVLDAFLTQ